MYKTLAGPKPLRIRFDKIDGFIIALDGKNEHLILFDYGLFNKFCDKIKCLISKKSGIANSINHNFRKIRIDSYNYLPIKKIMTFNNIIIFVKSVVNKNKNKYYYDMFLENGSYKDKLVFVYYKCHIMIELTFLKQLILTRQAHQKRVMFVTIGIS